MPVRKSLPFSKSTPSDLRRPQGKTPAAGTKSRVEERRQARARTLRTLNVYEKTGTYRLSRAFR
jgi:ribosomal protein L32